MLGSVEAEMAMEDYRAEIQEAACRLRFQVEYSQSALRNLTLVNGGAIIALLTFIGNSNSTMSIISTKWSFSWFSLGLFLSLISYFGAFFSQKFFMNVSFYKAWNAQYQARSLPAPYDITQDFKKGNRAMCAGIISALFSATCFVIGSFVALDGFV